MPSESVPDPFVRLVRPGFPKIEGCVHGIHRLSVLSDFMRMGIRKDRKRHPVQAGAHMLGVEGMAMDSRKTAPEDGRSGLPDTARVLYEREDADQGGPAVICFEQAEVQSGQREENGRRFVRELQDILSVWPRHTPL